MLKCVCQVSVMSPGDIVKTRLQCQTDSRPGTTTVSKPRYLGAVHCLLSIIKEEGFLGLYRGALPLMLRDGPSYALYFLTYASICDWLTQPGEKRPGESVDECLVASLLKHLNLGSSLFSGWSGVMLAGGAAGMAGWTVGTPMDVIKARLQVDGARQAKQYKGFFHCVAETARVEGAAVLFRSLGINCLRAFPVNMVVFLTYELLTGLLRDKPDSNDPPRLGIK